MGILFFVYAFIVTVVELFGEFFAFLKKYWVLLAMSIGIVILSGYLALPREGFPFVLDEYLLNFGVILVGMVIFFGGIFGFIWVAQDIKRHRQLGELPEQEETKE